MQTAAGAAPAPPCDVKHVVLLQCSHASNPPFLVGYCCLCRKPHHADAKPEHPKSADPKPEHAKPADSKPEHAKPDAKPLQDLLPLQDLAKLSLEDASDLADAKPEETEAGVDPFAKKKRTAFKLVDQNLLRDVVAQQQAPWSQANLLFFQHAFRKAAGAAATMRAGPMREKLLDGDAEHDELPCLGDAARDLAAST